jgi:hypothetical protein
MATKKLVDPKARPRPLLARHGDSKFIGDEPVFDDEVVPAKRQSTLMRTFNWYNYNCDNKQAIEFLANYLDGLPKRKALASAVRNNPNHTVNAIGWICRMIRMGWKPNRHEMRHVVAFLKKVPVEKPAPKAEKKEEEVAVWKPTIQDRLREMLHEAAGELDGRIDDFVISGCKEDKVQAFSFLKEFNLPQVQAAKLPQMYEGTIIELEEALAGKDEQLKEGYSHFTKTQLKALIKTYQGIIKDIESYVTTKKVQRKPRKVKARSADKIVSKVKFKTEDNELKVVSANPTTILGASEVWVFNTKTRKIGRYVSEYSGSLGVKGTSITGYSEVESIQKTLRKPVEKIKEFMGVTKAQTKKFMTNIKAVDIKLNGRLSVDILILKVFK